MSSASVASRPNPVTNSSFHKDSGSKHGSDFNSAENRNAKSQSRSQVQAPAKDDDLSTKSKTAHGPSESQSQSTSEPKQTPSQNTKQDGAATDKSSSSPKSANTEQKDGQHDENADGDAPAGDDEYPEQLHAGHLDGVGPEYGKMHSVTLGDRILGAKEQLKGTFKRDPELKQKGHERLTGELKKKETEDQGSNPFQEADDDKKDEGKADESPKGDESAAKIRDDDEAKSKSKSSEGIDEGKQEEQGTTSVPHAHPTEKGREEQAASVKPEGEGHTNLEQKGQDKVAAGEPN